MYSLDYLPIAMKDMVDIVTYVHKELQNPTAASKLSEKMINCAERLTELPYMYPIYSTIRALKQEYRRVAISNYLMFYWVDEEKKKITVARVIYGKRNHLNILE